MKPRIILSGLIIGVTILTSTPILAEIKLPGNLGIPTIGLYKQGHSEKISRLGKPSGTITAPPPNATVGFISSKSGNTPESPLNTGSMPNTLSLKDTSSRDAGVLSMYNNGVKDLSFDGSLNISSKESITDGTKFFPKSISKIDKKNGFEGNGVSFVYSFIDNPAAPKIKIPVVGDNFLKPLNVQVSAVPIPGTLPLFGIGLVGLMGLKKRRKEAAVG
ncbi:MAG: PEP-CTERM sorting domain-containing protein [Alphaproteobacteria bacterium]